MVTAEPAESVASLLLRALVRSDMGAYLRSENHAPLLSITSQPSAALVAARSAITAHPNQRLPVRTTCLLPYPGFETRACLPTDCFGDGLGLYLGSAADHRRRLRLRCRSSVFLELASRPVEVGDASSVHSFALAQMDSGARSWSEPAVPAAPPRSTMSIFARATYMRAHTDAMPDTSARDPLQHSSLVSNRPTTRILDRLSDPQCSDPPLLPPSGYCTHTVDIA